MMKILVKTPFYQDNKYLLHLLEHCILESEDLSAQLQLSDIDAASYTGYTCFEREYLPLEHIIQYFQIPITQHNFLLHQKIIKKELRNTSFGQKIYEKTLQKVFSKDLVTNSLDDIKFEQLLEYQKEYYQANNMILIDENGIINQQWGKGKSLQTFSPKLSGYHIPEYFLLRYQGEKSHILVSKDNAPSSILILDFFCDLCEAFWYREETQKGEYFNGGFDYSFTDRGLLVSREDDFPRYNLKKRKSFFEIFKAYYCERIINGGKKTYIPHIALFFDIFISKENHKNLISSIDFPLILDLIKQFKLI